MTKAISCIMLVDDDQYDNFFHEREIKKIDLKVKVIKKTSGLDALDYLKSMEEKREIKPDLIFLDLNMPDIDGWEFLKEFSRLDTIIKDRLMIIILTTSKNPTDRLRAKAWGFVSGYLNKPLTKATLEDIIKTYFVTNQS